MPCLGAKHTHNLFSEIWRDRKIPVRMTQVTVRKQAEKTCSSTIPEIGKQENTRNFECETLKIYLGELSPLVTLRSSIHPYSIQRQARQNIPVRKTQARARSQAEKTCSSTTPEIGKQEKLSLST